MGGAAVSLDLVAIAERFKRASQPVTPSAPVAGTSRPSHPGADVLASNPPVTGHGPAVYSNTGQEAEPGPAGLTSPPRRTAGRGPRRRRWLPPSSPAERMAETVDPPPTLYRCPHCGERHQPFPMATGFADLYGRPLVRDPYGAEPLGRGPADETSLRRDRFSAWRASPPEPPPSPTPSIRERWAHMWGGDQADQPGQPARMTLLDVIRRLGEKPPWA
jgi:hypothetical protein